LHNTVVRSLTRCTSKLKEAAQRQASEVSPIEAILPVMVPTEQILTAAQRHGKARRPYRLERCEEVVRRHGNGESIRAIGLALDVDRRTVGGLVRTLYAI
jgi:hypothetical protein